MGRSSKLKVKSSKFKVKSPACLRQVARRFQAGKKLKAQSSKFTRPGLAQVKSLKSKV